MLPLRQRLDAEKEKEKGQPLSSYEVIEIEDPTASIVSLVFGVSIWYFLVEVFTPYSIFNIDFR